MENIKTPVVEKGRWKEALLYGMLFLCPDYRKGKRLVWLPDYDNIVAWLESLRMPYVQEVTDTKHFVCEHWNDTHDFIEDRDEKDIEITYQIPVYEYHGKGLLLIGTCGQGKSFITCQILPRLFDYALNHTTWKSSDFNNAIYYSLVEDTRYSGETYRMDINGNPIIKPKSTRLFEDRCFKIFKGRSINDEIDEDGYNRILNSCGRFNVIDDLGEESEMNHYGTKSMVMCDVMDAWSEYAAEEGEFYYYNRKGKPTYGIPILSTNLNVDELESKYGSRFISRIKRCFSHVVVLQGDDLGGHDDEPLDISALPFYDDWLKFSADYPPQKYCGFIGYIWTRFHIPIDSEDTNNDVAKFIDQHRETQKKFSESHD